MKLADILIEAGIKPEDLHPKCKFIAQDGDNNVVIEYEVRPRLFSKVSYYDCEYQIYYSGGVNKSYSLADDWQTPLSREDFIAAYNSHHKIETLPSDSEMLDFVINDVIDITVDYQGLWSVRFIDGPSIGIKKSNIPRAAIAAAMAKEAKSWKKTN